MKRIISVALAAAALGLTATGCTHLAAKITCGTKALTWYHEQNGKADTKAVATALVAVGNADKAAAKAHFSPATLNTVRTSTNHMLAAVNTLRGNLPPACVPGLDSHISAGLDSFATAGSDELAAVKAAQAKNYSAVKTDLTKAGAAFRAGGTQFTTAGHLIRKYVTS